MAWDWGTAHWDAIKWVLGPSGGGLLVTAWFKRTRVRVRRLTLGSNPRLLGFEAENIGDKRTSMEPSFKLVGYTPKRKRHTYAFNIANDDRALDPHTVKVFNASHSNPENRLIAFLWYMTFVMPLTKGKTIRIRFRDGSLKSTGFLPFYWGLLLFRLFGWVPDETDSQGRATRAVPDEFQAPPTLITGKPEHPALQERAHRVCVVECKLINESRDKLAIVDHVEAFNIRGEPITIDWSDGISDVGMPDNCGGRIRVEREKENKLYIRDRMGEDMNFVRIVIHHNLPLSPATATLDDYFVEGATA